MNNGSIDSFNPSARTADDQLLEVAIQVLKLLADALQPDEPKVARVYALVIELNKLRRDAVAAALDDARLKRARDNGTLTAGPHF